MTYLTYLLIGLVFAVGAMAAQARFVSFWAQRPEDYDEGPEFDIREKLNGPLVCEGVIFGPMGRVSSRFFAEFDAQWDGDTGVMKEVFTYDSGSVQHREWKLTVLPGGKIRAEANDLVGPGTGAQMGSAVKLNYRIKLTEDAGGHELDTTDWMYLTPNGAIMNRSQFRKFGIKVAELVATIRPRAAEAAQEQAA